MRIAIHSEQFDGRGTGKWPYDYGIALRNILGHELTFITSIHPPNEGLPKIKNEFKTILYDETDSNSIKNKLEQIISQEKIDFIYMAKSGQNDWKTPSNCKSGIHCVFLMNEPHGNVYAGISESLAVRFNKKEFVPFIIKNYNPTENIRNKFNIPKNAMVIGRSGGMDTFNVNFVKEAIKKILEYRKDIYFIFLNTQEFYNHERIIYLPWIGNEQEKFNFIHSCDAMLHARSGGESFGLAIGEFSIANKPVITWTGKNDPWWCHDKCHIDILNDKAILYNDEQELLDILYSIDHSFINSHNWDKYSDKFSESMVINKFREEFLEN
jgi:glycosyltransferase involved in cell wall biosynthesis